jgi:hypothetical protein
VDWDAVARDYFTGNESIDEICERHGVGHGDLLAYAASRDWTPRRPTRPHPDDLGTLASALALAMFSVRGAEHRRRCFVAAMTSLDAKVGEVAEVLGLSEANVRKEFSRELGVRRSVSVG